MVRTLLSWRWAASTVLLVAAVVTMALLGAWQWERSVPTAAREEVDPAQVDPASLPEVTSISRAPGDGALVPDDVSGDLVRVEGTWRPDRTLLVADRELDGRSGRWATTAVELPGGTGLVPVVRGWVPDGTTAADVPAVDGPVVLVGWVQQSEPLDIPVDLVQPEGVVGLLSTADLANRWSEELVPGFVVLAAAPAGPPGPDSATGSGRTGPVLLPAPPAEQTEARDWRNLAYSAQWFVFAAFAVLLWWRMLRDDVSRRAAVENAGADDLPPVRDLPQPRPAERSTT